MHNISFDESQYRVVQFLRVSTSEKNTSPMQFEERVIVFDVICFPNDTPSRKEEDGGHNFQTGPLYMKTINGKVLGGL